MPPSSRAPFLNRIRKLASIVVCVACVVGCDRSQRSVAKSPDSPTNKETSNGRDGVDSLVGGRRWPIAESFDSRTVRFAGRSEWYSSGKIVLWFDTAITRDGNASIAHAVADSLIVSGVAPNELLAPICTIGGVDQNGQTVGLIQKDEHEDWHRPRLAWRFDSALVRIRQVSPDSVVCIRLL